MSISGVNHMKKIYALLISLLFLSTVACTVDFTTTKGVVSSVTTSPITQTTTEMDMNDVISEVYAKIYADLYDEIRSEIINDISEEQFREIYDDVLQDLYNKIGTGEITLEALSTSSQILQVALNAAPGVIGVANLNIKGAVQSVGSGVIYKQTGTTYYVVTNNHVIEGGTSYQIQFEDETTVDATLIGFDSLVDLAVLTFVSSKELTVLQFGDSESLTKGNMVLAVGNPNGFDYFGSVTLGIVSGLNRYFDIDNDDVTDMFVNYIQHDAAINSGNSGGALLNLNGEVIGINVIKIASTEIEGMGFAIPSELVARICSDIELYGVSKQVPVLGITFVDIMSNPNYFVSNNITLPGSITSGFYVIGVLNNTSLYGYVQNGDIITQIADVVITNSLDFKAGFSKYRVGDVIDIVVYRAGQSLTITDIELKPKP